MRIFSKYTIIIFILANLGAITLLHSQTTMIDKMYDESEIVIQGSIKGINCSHGVGVADCWYALEVDSIYKGTPYIYIMHGGDFLQARKSITMEEIDREYKVIYFSKGCLYILRLDPFIPEQFADQCYDVGDHMIVFLHDHEQRIKDILTKDINSHYSYQMTDQWLGAVPANSYISMHLKKLNASRQ